MELVFVVAALYVIVIYSKMKDDVRSGALTDEELNKMWYSIFLFKNKVARRCKNL